MSIIAPTPLAPHDLRNPRNMQAGPKSPGLSISVGAGHAGASNSSGAPEFSKSVGAQPSTAPSHVGLGLSSASGSAISPTRSTFDAPAPNGPRPVDWRRKSTSGDVRMAVIAGDDEDEAEGSDPRSKLLGDRSSLPSPGSSSRRKSAFGLAPPSAGGGQLIETALTHPAVPVAAYCAASIVMTVVNKFVVSGHHFTMNFLLLTIQSVVCVGCVMALKQAKVMSYRDFTVDEARKWFPISFLLVSVIYTGSKSLQFLPIPVYTIFKNLTIIVIAYGEVLWFRGTVTPLTLGSFGLMVLSSLIAAWSDVARTFSGEGVLDEKAVTSSAGYVWMFLNVLVSAGYVLGMRKRIKVTNFKDVDVLFLNNALSVPVLVIFSLLLEDWSSESLQANFPAEGRGFLLFAMAFSGAAAVFISYTTAWCIRATSSTTYSMVGALNKLPVAASGILFFSDPATLSSVSAIIVGGVAGLVYAVARQQQQKNEASLTGRGPR